MESVVVVGPATPRPFVITAHELQTEFNTLTGYIQEASQSRYVPEFVHLLQQGQKMLLTILKLLESRRIKKDWFNYFVPPVLMCYVSKFLDVPDLMRVECVCHVWRNNLITPAIADRLWRRIWISCEWIQTPLLSDSTTPWRDHVRSRLAIEKNWRFGKYKIQHIVNHGGLVHAVSFGQEILTTAGNDRQVRLWDLKTGSCTTVLSGHNDWVRTVKLSADTSLVLSGSDDQTIKIWNVQTGICISTLHGHRSAVVALTTLPDTSRLGSASDDNTIKEWDIERGECIQTLCGHTSTIWSIGACDKQLVSGSNDTTVKDWSLNSGLCIRTLQGHKGAVHSVNIDPRRIVSGSADDSLRVWERRGGSCMMKLIGHSGSVRSIGVAGRRIVSGSFDCSIKIWDIGSSNWDDLEGEDTEKEDSTEEHEQKLLRQREIPHFESLRNFTRQNRRSKMRQKGSDRELDRSRENSLVRGLDSSRENSLVQTNTGDNGSESSKLRGENKDGGQGSGFLLLPSGQLTSGSSSRAESPAVLKGDTKARLDPGRVQSEELRSLESIQTLEDHEDHVLALQCDTERLISGDWTGKVIIRQFVNLDNSSIEHPEDIKDPSSNELYMSYRSGGRGGSSTVSGRGISKTKTRENRSRSDTTLQHQKLKTTTL